jgi:hypothetical protein
MPDLDILLSELYRRHWPNLQREISALDPQKRKLSYPFLLSELPLWNFTTGKRLMFFGQATNGWGEECLQVGAPNSIEPLMKLYSKFSNFQNYSKAQIKYAFEMLAAKVNPNLPNNNYIWNNLFKIDEGGKEPREDIKSALFRSFPVLNDELEILSPDVIVFFVGHKNDEWIKRIIDMTNQEPIGNYKVDELCRFTSRVNRYQVFRSYHPGYYFKKGEKDRIVEICDCITNAI